MQKDEPLDRYKYEKKLWQQGFKNIMGLDEVGRGCLAGPVVVAGVIFPVYYQNDLLKDSKQLSEKQRDELVYQIKEDAISWTIKEGSLELIEQKNILWASLITMHDIAQNNKPSPDFLLIDGNRFVPTLIPHECVVKGDDKSASIAAASILAKVYRDNLMKTLHHEFPEYNWEKNVGYATKDHYKGLEKFGITKYHRLGFNLKTSKYR
jgi:ribonuclease HII